MSKHNKFLLYTLTGIIALLFVLVLGLIVMLMRDDNSIPVSNSSELSEISSSSEEMPSSSEEIPSSSEETSVTDDSKTISDCTINEEGEYTIEETLSSLNIKSSDVTVENKSISGNVKIISSSNSGTITISNTNINGIIYVEKASANIILNNVKAREIKITDTATVSNITINGDTHFEKTYVNADVKLIQGDLTSNNTGFTHIGIGGSTDKFLNIDLEKITNTYLTVNYPSNIRLSAGTNLLQTFAYRQCHLYDEGTMDYLFVLSPNVSYNKLKIAIFNNYGYIATKGGEMLTNANLIDDSKNNTSKPTSTAKLTMPILENPPMFAKDAIYIKFAKVPNANSYTIKTYKNGKFLKEETIMDNKSDSYIFWEQSKFAIGDVVNFQICANHSNDSSKNSDFALSQSVSIA